MMGAPTILVAGLGRCGTSLVMQMLDAAGVRCVGSYPDFEVDAVAFALAEDPARWVEASEGRAVKVLDPHLLTPPLGLAYRAIWLSRDFEQQALSQLKMAGAPAGRRARRAMAGSLRKEERLARLALQASGAHVALELRFEDLLRGPHEAAEALARFIGLDVFDVALLDHMAERVVRRSPDCFPGFLEHHLVSCPLILHESPPCVVWSGGSR